MGKKLDALLGRKFKTSKFKATVNLALSRLSVLKNQRRARLSIARSDVLQLLNLNHHENALLRVDQVIKEQNMLDVYEMIDGFCHFLIERVNLIEQERECPVELKEAASSLLYAAPRCGEFPELQEIRAILTARFGKEFAYGAMELRSNCGVSLMMIQKLSSRQSKLESRMKMLTEIATENGILLQLEEVSPVIIEEKLVVERRQDQPKPEAKMETIAANTKLEGDFTVLPDEVEEVLSFSESVRGRKKYRDVADAAQAAFESAAYAAAAARAAVELSRSESLDSDNQGSPGSRPRGDGPKPMKSKLHMSEEKGSRQMGYQKTNPTPKYDSESEYEAISMGNKGERSRHDVKAASFDSSDSDGYSDEDNIRSVDKGRGNPLGKKMVFDESDDENGDEQTGFSSSRNYNLRFDGKRSPYGNETFNSVKDYNISEGQNRNTYYEQQSQVRYKAGGKTDLGDGNPGTPYGGTPQLNLEKKPISVRTKYVYGR